jgi:hypothetical protein
VVVARSYDEFRTALIGRHQNAWTSGLSTLGDALYIASIPAGLIARSFWVFLAVNASGSVAQVVAHFFQPGTVTEEVASVLRHPMWAVRAETARVVGHS